jgi:hypothetical protein
MRTSVVPLPSTALKISSGCSVFSELYRITVPCLYSTLHTHPRFHRSWSVLLPHDFLSRPMAISEGATIQYSVYRHRRIYLPRTLVNKAKKDGRGLRRPQHLINIDPDAERQDGTRCTPKAFTSWKSRLPDRDHTRQKEEPWRPSRKPARRRKLPESLIPTWRA